MAVLGLCCRAQAFSGCREQGLLSGCGAWASLLWRQALGTPASAAAARGLRSTGPVLGVHGLSCSVVRGTFPDQVLKPCLYH